MPPFLVRAVGIIEVQDDPQQDSDYSRRSSSTVSSLLFPGSNVHRSHQLPRKGVDGLENSGLKNSAAQSCSLVTADIEALTAELVHEIDQMSQRISTARRSPDWFV